MLLRRITEHVKAQNWFAVFLDFTIVVIGVWFALLGGEWADNRQARSALAIAEQDIRSEMAGSYYYANERLSISECRKARYKALGELLLKPDTKWSGSPGAYGEGALTDYRVFAPVLRSSERPFKSTVWDAELSKGTLDIMDSSKRQVFADYYQIVKEMEYSQGTVYQTESRLQALANPLSLSTSDRLRYYDVLGEADAQSALLELNARHLTELAEENNLELFSEEDRQLERNYVVEANESLITIYGDCVSAIELPLLSSE